MGFKSKHDLKTGPLGYPLVDLIDTFYDGAVNVQAFGAVGDGVTDDTVSIAATIAHAGAQGTAFFPYGNYKATSTIDAGTTNLVGAAGGWSKTVLSFSGLSASEDGIEIKSNNNDRTQSGRLENLSVISTDGGGRNGVWYQGGRFGLLRDVAIYDWGGIGLLGKQEAQFDWVENFRLQNVEINGCAGYGLQIETVDFASNLGQFWNQLIWDNVKIRDNVGGDVRFNFGDTLGSNAVKVGSLVMNQVQLTTNADRANQNSIVIDKNASAGGAVGSIVANACTFERVAFPVTDFVVVDNSSGDDGLLSLVLDGCSTAGYVKAAADKHSIIDNAHPAILDLTTSPSVSMKSSIQTFGTTPAIEGTSAFPATGSYDLFDTVANHSYLVLAKNLTGTVYAYSLVIASSVNAPVLVSLAQSGNLTITNTGSTIEASNAGGAAINGHWTALRIL